MTKVISLSDEAYEELTQLKNTKESFSSVVIRLASEKKKKDIMEFAGKWPGPKEELDKIFNEILEERHKTKMRKFKW